MGNKSTDLHRIDMQTKNISTNQKKAKSEARYWKRF
jgi:hypothetical protein